MPIEDAEPVAYAARRKFDDAAELFYAEEVCDRIRERYDLIPLYRAPQPAKPIEATDEMVQAATIAIFTAAPLLSMTGARALARDALAAALEEAGR